MPPITVVIAAGDKTSRTLSLDTLQPEKGIAVVGVARNGLEAIKAADRLKPRILLLYLNLFKGKRDRLIRALRQKSPRTKIILLTRRARENQILEALSHGALGYLKEKAINGFLVKAVRKVDAGEAWVPRKVVARIIECLASRTADL
jgi:DNA-binding NarL/FixJ family response regulator